MKKRNEMEQCLFNVKKKDNHHHIVNDKSLQQLATQCIFLTRSDLLIIYASSETSTSQISLVQRKINVE